MKSSTVECTFRQREHGAASWSQVSSTCAHRERDTCSKQTPHTAHDVAVPRAYKQNRSLESGFACVAVPRNYMYMNA